MPHSESLKADSNAALAIVRTYVDGQDWILCDGIGIVKAVKRPK